MKDEGRKSLIFVRPTPSAIYRELFFSILYLPSSHFIPNPQSVARYVLYTSAASLMKVIKTPPPSLLRARFATVLEHLPSVPSVVPPQSPTEWSGFPSFYACIYRMFRKRAEFVHSEVFLRVSVWRVEQYDLNVTGKCAI